MLRRKVSIRLFLTILVCLTSVLGASAPFANMLERTGWDDRYLKYKECGAYFVGFDMQEIASDTKIDYEDELELLSEYDINNIRIWLYTSWFGTDGPGLDILYPWRVVEAGKNGKRKFDIDNWDPEYWNRLRNVVAYAQKKGIIIQISLFSAQEPFSYFTEKGKFSKIEYAFRNKDNIQRFGKPTADGDFYPSFFDLDYKEKGKFLQDYQKALIEKAIMELDEYDNVYFELMNEGPGPKNIVNDRYYFQWAEEMLAFIKSLTPTLVSMSTEGYIHMEGPQVKYDKLVSRVSGNMDLDGQSFHLYSDNPNLMSARLHNFQFQQQILLGNEGGDYYDVDRSAGYPNYIVSKNVTKLFNEIRHGWGYMTSGGYYLAYQGPDTTGSEVWKDMASALQAMRNIVETVDYWEMRPVREDGSEYDDVVEQGPLDNNNWQVLAKEGDQYLVYFWGEGEEVVNPADDNALAPDVELSNSGEGEGDAGIDSADPGQPGSYSLLCSADSNVDGSDAACDGGSFSDTLWVYLWPEGNVEGVDFYVDGVFSNTERVAPYELDSGSPTTFSTGTHTVRAVVNLTGGGSEEVITTFTVGTIPREVVLKGGASLGDTVLIDLPPGRYTYKWYDTRALKKPLLSGMVSGDYRLTIPSPLSDWVPAAGVVLVVSKRPDTLVSVLSSP